MVATRLKCGGILNYIKFIAECNIKELWKSVKIWQSYRHEFGGLLTLEHSID